MSEWKDIWKDWKAGHYVAAISGAAFLTFMWALEDGVFFEGGGDSTYQSPAPPSSPGGPTTSSQSSPSSGGPATTLPPSGLVACSGVSGTKCTGDNEYCHLPDGYCTVADASGTCETKPIMCPAISAPVCGCDGKTYDNACRAGMAGISVSANAVCNVSAPESTPAPTSAPEPQSDPSHSGARAGDEPQPPIPRSPKESVIVVPKPAPGSGLPDYPPNEERLGHEGIVIIHLCVEPDGSVSEVDIKQSCGYPALDRAALDQARRTRWLAGTVDGRKVHMCFDQSYRFELPKKFGGPRERFELN
jgi:TonB family protein